MSEITATVPPRDRVRPWAIALLTLTLALAFLVLWFCYGLSLDDGDTTATDARTALRSLGNWAFGIVLVVQSAAGCVAVAQRSRGRRAITLAAAVTVLITLVGVPAGAVHGVRQKFNQYPDLPWCAAGFRGGPAVPVTRAAEAGFAELDHPGPVSGGGSSGIDGCSGELRLRETVDVPAAYRDTLTDTGWRVRQHETDLVTARKDGQDFEAVRDQHGSWWIWIGPAGLKPQPTSPGQVSPRR